MVNHYFNVMIKRKIRITVSDPDSIWKEIEQDVFSDFSFQLPTLFPEQIPDDVSANLSFEFIPEDPNLKNYIKPGLDPFLSSFFSIRVQKISDDQLKYQSYQNWVEKAIKYNEPFCVFLIQERSLFGSSNIGLFTQFGSIPPERQFIIQYKSPLHLAEQQQEQIQNRFKDIVTESFIECDSEAMDIIHSEKYPFSQISHLRVWRYLMLFFFGFLETSIKGFYEIYAEFSKHDLYCDVIPPVEPSWITLYPFINGDDDVSILIFALSGCLASFYIKKEYKMILNMFMSNLFILQSKSSLNKNVVNNWACQSLEAMADLDFIEMNSDNDGDDAEKENIDITEQFLMQLFRNRLSDGNQKQIDEVYHKLMIRLSEKKFARAALNVLYSNNQLFNDMTKCWSFGQKAGLNLVKEAINEKKYSRIQFFAKPLFLDCTSPEIKLTLFNTLSNLDSEVLIKDPFPCQLQFTSDAFYSAIKNNYTFIINIKCRFKMINIFPTQYDSATLFMRNDKKGDRNLTSHFTSKDININAFQIVAFLNESGKWNFDHLELRKGSLTFNWQIETGYCVYVDEYEKPEVNVTFPSLIGFGQLLPIIFSVDFPTLEKNASFKLAFDSPSLIIPDQHGNAEIHHLSSSLNSDTNATFNVTESVLSFNISIDRSDFNCDSRFIARINCKQKNNIDSANLHVITAISEIKYKFIFRVVFTFPIECSLRFISEKFAHICLRNTASVPFIIESAEMLPSTWGKQVINAGEELFLIGQRSYDNDLLKIFVRDEKGSSIAMSWDINEKMMRPIIEAEIKGTPICGRLYKIKLLGLPRGKFHVENTKDIVISGFTTIEQFNGGNLVFSIIPLKSGLLKLPFISLNHVSHVIHQEYINVIQPKATLLSPFVNL